MNSFDSFLAALAIWRLTGGSLAADGWLTGGSLAAHWRLTGGALAAHWRLDQCWAWPGPTAFALYQKRKLHIKRRPYGFVCVDWTRGKG